jgi:PAS domain S-box-containing protein
VSGPQGEQVFTLQGAEYAYRALVEAMNEGAATLGADGTVLYCNQHLADLLGVPFEQIIGHGAARLFGETSGRFEALFSLALTDDVAKAEIVAGDRELPLYLSLRKMKVVGPTSVCMVVTDLTESRKWEELLAAGRLANSILESAAEAIAVCDEAGIIIRGNEALESLCGFNPLFQSFENALPLHVDDSPQTPRKFSVSAAINGELLQGQGMSFERRDGRVFALLLSSGRISGNSGIIGCVFTLTDITQRKRVTQALIQSEKLASVGRLASTIAHEINNPLEAIGNALYLAIISPQITPTVKGYVELAVQELERVTHVTRQTLAFHRDNKSPMPIDLCESLEGVLNLLAMRLRSRGIAIDRRYASAEPVLGVAGEIRQIVSNLLSNSMDALNSNGKLMCRVARSFGKSGAPAIRLTIADTGSGILPEHFKKIFEAFFTTKEIVGTGLGLWITAQIVEKHGATIQARSKPQKGTVISITFPRIKMETAKKVQGTNGEARDISC